MSQLPDHEPMLIEKANAEKYGLCRIPGLVMTDKNTLLGYYECRSDYSDWAQIDLKVIRSRDLGESFEEALLIEGNGDTLNNPVMIVNGDSIHLLFLCNYHRLYHSVSTDDGITFSEPKDITSVLESDVPYTVAAVGPGHGIVHEGRMIVPLWFGYNPDDPKAHHPSSVRTLYSEDNGKAWQLGDVIGEDVLHDANESALAVNADGRVIISIRHNTDGEKNRAISVSDNGIGGWSEVKFEKNLPDPRCMGSMFSYEGAVYHINCVTESGRKNLTVKKSEDNFATFEGFPVSEKGGYSDLVIHNGVAYVLYERDVLHKTDVENNDGLYFTKINLK